jgi:hypothetical protein
MDSLDHDTPLDAPEPQVKDKRRHGCVTAWLILIIVINSLSGVVSFFGLGMSFDKIPQSLRAVLVALGFLSIVKVACAILLFQWKRIGFWGFLVISAAALVINVRYDVGEISTQV